MNQSYIMSTLQYINFRSISSIPWWGDRNQYRINFFCFINLSENYSPYNSPFYMDYYNKHLHMRWHLHKYCDSTAVTSMLPLFAQSWYKNNELTVTSMFFRFLGENSFLNLVNMGLASSTCVSTLPTNNDVSIWLLLLCPSAISFLVLFLKNHDFWKPSRLSQRIN